MKFIRYITIIVLNNFLWCQTILFPGDIFVVGINSNNGLCSGNSAEDIIYLVAFKDIVNSTVIDFTDNAWEREFPNYYGTTEGVYRFERIGGTISAGSVFSLTLPLNATTVQINNPDWNFTNIAGGISSLNMNDQGDQIFIMQGGNWSTSGTNKGIYDGNLLYGYNSRNIWNSVNSSTTSNLPIELECFHFTSSASPAKYQFYNAPLSPAPIWQWQNRIQNPSNFSNFTNCTDFNANFNLQQLLIIEGEILQPTDFTEICENEENPTYIFANNTTQCSFQWYSNTSNSYVGATPIAGANSYNFTPADNLIGSYYYFSIMNCPGSCPIQSNISHLQIVPLPIISTISYNN